MASRQRAIKELRRCEPCARDSWLVAHARKLAQMRGGGTSQYGSDLHAH